MIWRRTLWLAAPGLAVNALLLVLLLSEAWESPGLPVGSECCGWAYYSWENYRVMIFSQAGGMAVAIGAAFLLRRRRAVFLLLVYMIPVAALASTRLFVTLP